MIYGLKNGKSARVDEIVNEVLKYGGDQVTVIMWQLIQTCFETEKIPSQWMKGIIFPIYKAGDGRKPDNYRGISLLSVVAKVYTAVLHRRLSQWCEENNIISEEQGGFRPGRGCADQIYVLWNILMNRVGQKTYCCFIDLKKAFPSVWRNGLWKRLWDEGVRGKIWRIIRSLYENTESCVLIGEEKTNYFDVDVGVRQGCILSPTLFSIYINSMAEEINQSGIGIEVLGSRIAILLYADDIVLIAESAGDLQRGMHLITYWSRKWQCIFNRSKSQVVVYGSRKEREVEWMLGGGKVDQVDSYKYLGLEIKGNLGWTIFKQMLIEKAKKIMRIAWAMGIRKGRLTARAACGVWKTLVRPILEYGAEIWGAGEWEEAERLQREMAKRILGLKESTNNEVVLGELGWWKLKSRRDMLRLRYWRRLINMKQEKLPKRVYEWELRRWKGKRSWIRHTKKLLIGLGLQDYWKEQKVKETREEWGVLISKKIQEREQREWLRTIQKRPKLRTYILVKKKLEYENYLDIKDEAGRKALARLRSGTNELRIETGRHEGLERKDRTCWFGCNVVEDEQHFLKECWMYEDLREEAMVGVIGVQFQEIGIEKLLGKGNKHDIERVVVYIKRALARRRRILELREGTERKIRQ